MGDLIKKTESKAEKFWILLFRIPGVVLFFLPFIPITLSYISTNVEKTPLDKTDWQMLGIGFFLVWGSSYFGILGNKLGIFISNILGLKIKKEESEINTPEPRRNEPINNNQRR